MSNLNGVTSFADLEDVIDEIAIEEALGDGEIEVLPFLTHLSTSSLSNTRSRTLLFSSKTQIQDDAIVFIPEDGSSASVFSLPTDNLGELSDFAGST